MKNYVLQDTDGIVTFRMRTGKDFVENKMQLGAAVAILAAGKVAKSSEVEGFPIAVDNTYFFPGEIEEPVRKPRAKKG